MQTQKIRIKTYISVLVEKKNVQVFYKIFYDTFFLYREEEIFKPLSHTCLHVLISLFLRIFLARFQNLLTAQRI